jgi:hypothetical protein
LVAVVTGPTINTQPSTTAQSVCLNASASALSISASSPNGSTITYQWYSNTSASNAGGTAIGGATSSSYTPPNNVVGTKYYYVICTNNQGSTTSNVSAGITVNAAPQAASITGTSVDYLVVGGGGGGGFEGGGGGGGGQVNIGSVFLASGTFAVTIGSGGAGATTIGSQASNGGTTTLSLPTPIVSIGGGGGGSKNANGVSGANGGGGGHPIYSGGASAGGGFAGGNANNEGGGGGAGAGGVGVSAPGAGGGIGVSSSISGSATFYGGGGGGGSWQTTSTSNGVGGTGGGGRGGITNTTLAQSGAANSGGGGGGSGNSSSTPVAKNGGSGIVILRYLGSPSGTGGTITQSGGYTIHTFNSNGTFAFNNPSTAVVPNVTVCGSTSATFTGTVAAGFTLDWYNAASGGTLLSQGTSSYTTPVLSSTTTYYVAVRNSTTGCVSATRTAVTATITASITSTTGASRCGTGTVTLQAATAAGTINWYAASTGGSSLGTGTSYTTPSISTTTTYYADVTNNGCTTSPRTAVIATVNASPTPTITQTGCDVLTLGNYGAGNALNLGTSNTSKYVSIPSSLNASFNTNNITVEGWFNLSAADLSLPEPTLVGEAYISDNKVTFMLSRYSNQIRAGFFSGSAWSLALSASSIPANTWTHIAATYDQTSIKIYINGVLDGTLNTTTPIPSGTEVWYLGKRFAGADMISGVMDEIRIWNVARTQAQIQTSMNTSVAPNSTGLRAYYQLDESTGTSASDATGNGYTGTLMNNPTWQVPSTSILGGPPASFLWSPNGQTTNSITAATSGTYSAVVTNAAGCQSASISSSIIIGVTASSNQTICGGTSPANITLTGNTATIQWQSSTNNVNFTNISGATSATLTTGQMGVLNATTYYRANVTSTFCAPSTSNTVTITVNAQPTFTSTTGASRCGTGTVTLQATTAAGTINWYATLTGGSSLGTGTSYTTPSISTTTTYYADVTNNGCTSNPRTAVVATINTLPQAAANSGSVDYLVVGGGGGGGFDGAGGGGGGQVIMGSISLASGTYAVTIGNGGTNSTSYGAQASNGGTTTLSLPTPIVSIGGGGGGAKGANGATGANGGGGGHSNYAGAPGASGGFAGGNANGDGGGGGGGAGSAGATGSAGRNGGNGVSSSISGNLTYYGGGGGGGSYGNTGTGLGGIGGGGQGGLGNSPLATAGAANSGGGGGGAGEAQSNPGKNGGSGIVIVRYLGTPQGTGGTITQVGGYTIHTFNSNGSFAYNGSSSSIVPNMSSCGAAAITFTGTVVSGCTLDWYNAASGGTLLSQGTSSYTTPVLSSTTTYYVEVRNTSTGCVSATRAAVVASITAVSTASSSQSVCPGLLPSAITLTNYGGTLQWQTSSDNVTFTNIGGQTSATLPANSIGIMSGTKYIRAMVTNGSCVLPSNVVTLSPTSVSVVSALTTTSYVWNGQSSSDWGTLSNWYSYNGSSLVPAAALPSNAHTVVIPANSTCILNQPSISSGAIIITNLAVETGSQLTQSGGSLLLYGNYSNNGTLNSTGGLTNFYGPSSATISGSGSIQFAKMRVNKLSGASITLQRPVTVTDSLTMVLGNINTTTTNILTLGISSSSPGKLVYTNGTIVGPFKRFFTNAATIGTDGRFPVGTAAYNRYAEINFGTTPGTDQSLTVQYISGLPMQGGSALYNGLPIVASGELIQNYSGDGYWSVIPTNNSYTTPINFVNYSLTLNANNLTGMQIPQICRIIKSPGSNTVNQHHIAWQSCGTHTTIPGTANPTAFVITSTAAQGFSWFNIGTSNNQALPVEFSKMTTTCEDELVRITWTTESEHNNDYFRIEKSNTGFEWEILGTVEGVGNSTTEQTYTYFDENQRINNYYRLYQVDIDGAQELLSTMYSECEGTNSNIESFPNPSHESFSIHWKQFKTKGDAHISILNTNGKRVFYEKVVLDLGTNLFIIKADLAPGIYMIELIDDNYERKLIKHVVN